MARRRFTGYAVNVEESQAILQEMEALGEWFGKKRKEYMERAQVQQSEYKLMEALTDGGVKTEADLAKLLNRSQGNVSKLLKRLSNQGWLSMSRKGRERRVEATEEGQEMFSRGKKQMQMMMKCWLHQVPPKEQKQILKSLRRLNERARGWEYDLDFASLEWRPKGGRDDKPRRRGRVGQFRVGGAARVEIGGGGRK
jgi:DNA-binding MarR family transcriptional regulator